MEEWQKEHIHKNLVELIKYTNCNVHLTSRLRSDGVLSDHDIETLELLYLTPSEKSKSLYEIVQTRVGSYDILLRSLNETRQSGAAKILKDHNIIFRSFGSISYDSNHVLGTGTAGTKVFKGTFIDSDVAVKVLNSDFIDPEVALREVDMLKKVDNHPNILRYFHAEENDNFIYIALEICLISLQDEIQMNLLKLNPLYILEKCTMGLQHLHKHNIIHRDMKPANVLLSENQQVKIADFGLSTEIPSDMTSVSVHTAGGTADWTAPEILNQNSEVYVTDERNRMTTSADVFSLGCIFAFVLTKGSHPFGAPLIRQHNICTNNPQLVSLHIDSEWLELIEEMIAAVPRRRPSCTQILDSYCFQHQVQNSTKMTTIPFKGSSVASSTEPKPSTSSVHVRQGNSGPSNLQNDASHITNITTTDKPNANDNKAKRETVKRPDNLDIERNIPASRFTAEGLHQEYSDLTINHMNIGSGWNVANKRGESVLHFVASNGNVEAMKYFISLGADVNSKDIEQKTVGHRIFSASKNFNEALLLALRHKLDVNAVDKDGNTILLLAASSSRPMWILEEIVRFGGDSNYTNNRGESVLHVCAEKGNLEALKYFESLGANITARDNEERTVLHRAQSAQQNFEEMVDFLLHKKLDINSVDKTGCNLLLLATASSRSKESLEKIVEHGGDWKSTNMHGQSVLHFAASHGHVEALKYFISLGADVTVLDNDRCGLIHHAKSAPHTFREIVKLSQQHKLDINATNKDGDTILLLAIVAGKTKGDLETIVKLGGDWKMRNNKGQSVVHLCAKRGSEKMLEYFLSLGADVNWSDTEQRTGTNAIITSGITDNGILKTVLEKTLDINAVDKYGNNLILLAASSGTSQDVLKEIVGFGGDWEIRNLRGESVLHLSAANGQYVALDYFLSLGANVNATDNDGCTAGHRVFTGRRTSIRQCLKILFDHNLDVHAIDKNGDNLLLLAAKNGSTKEELEEIVQMGNKASLSRNKDGGN